MLLKEWPATGPEKLWVANDAGKGNTYPVIIQGYYSATRIDISADGKIKVKVLGTDGTTQLEKTYQHQS